jgi:hypothetical protein
MKTVQMRIAGNRRIVVLLAMCAIMVLGFVSSGLAATPTVKGAAYDCLKQFMGDYDKAGFSKVVKIGNKATYRTKLNELTVKVDTSLSAFAKYDPVTKTITFSIDPRKVPKDERLAFGETAWHELTHAIEDEHGDIGVFDSESYAERNVDYMTHVVRMALPALEQMEKKAGKGAKAAELEKQWRLFVKRVADASVLPSNVAYPPNFETMRTWFGFEVDPEVIKDFYLKSKTKKWANIRKALKGEPITWTGEWDTNWGLMSLSQSGATVAGSYLHENGKISGTTAGRVFTGTWFETPPGGFHDPSGPCTLTLAEDGDSFAGTWSYDHGGGGDWTGTRVR